MILVPDIFSFFLWTDIKRQYISLSLERKLYQLHDFSSSNDLSLQRIKLDATEYTNSNTSADLNFQMLSVTNKKFLRCKCLAVPGIPNVNFYVIAIGEI